MYRFFYALEKFNRAIYTLATDKDDVRKRLLHVFNDELMMITPEHLPEQCKADFKWIEKTITKYDEIYEGQKKVFYTPDGRLDHYLPGTIQATLAIIRKSTGEKIAIKIYNIWSVLNSEFEKHN